MLTSDLLRVKVTGEYVTPRYIKEKDKSLVEIALQLTNMYQEHIGKTKGELENCFEEEFGQSSKIQLLKGLFKLLDSRSSYETYDEHDPVSMRKQLFLFAAQRHQANNFEREQVIDEFASKQKLSREIIERYMFADLKDNQVICEYNPIAPENLLKRYNTALAQAILYKAMRLEIQIIDKNNLRYRQLFRAIKFCQLLYLITGNENDGFSIVLDGPMSIFKASQKYGLSMALFLPSLLLCDGWQLKAYVLWQKGKSEKIFKLDHHQALYSHYPDTGMYCPPEIQAFADRFTSLDSSWHISSDCDFLELTSQTICIPDYIFTHKETKQKIYLEIFGFWRKVALEKRLQLQNASKDHTIILAVSDKLNVDKKQAKQEHHAIYYYKGVLIPKKVLELLDSLI